VKPRPRQALPLSKLRGVPGEVRLALKRRRITTCEQLLRAAGPRDARTSLADTVGVEAGVLDLLVRRADLARVNGIGAVFGMMLEAQGVRDVQGLRHQDPLRLHGRLAAYNSLERLARRAPTQEEVEDWVNQARALPDRIEA
jgi:hypothetical protein